MNRRIGSMAFLFALMLIQGCTGNDDITSKEHGKGDGITQEEGLIVTILNEAADAESKFYSTKDSASILRFYAEDYVGIKDGRLETVKDHKQYLAAVLEQITLGDPIGISSKLKKPSVEGKFGWAIYEYEYKVGRSGGKCGVQQQVSQGHCTAILRKQADSWLIRHEHCSSTSPTPF